jgi:hypothetical protein
MLSISLVTYDCVEAGDELAYTRDQARLLKFVSDDETVVEGGNGRIEASRREGCSV